jgi:uncharacterized protein (TIGR02145 family)
MSIESDASKWKSNVSRILEVDPEGILLTETVKKYFDEVAAVFKKGTFDAENTKKQLKVLRRRNTRLSGKPIAVELSSFINVTERYATKTEEAFTSFVKALSSNARISSNGNSTRTSSRQHQAQSSRQKPLPDPPDALDSIISELDNLADESPSRTPPPPRISTILRSRLNSLASIENYQRVERVAIENPFANEVVEKKSRLPWIIGMILLLLGIFFVSIHLNKDNSSVSKEAMTDSHEGSTYKRSMTDSRDGKTYKTVKIGSQIWMAENLNFRTKDSWCNDNKESNCSKYGRLYTWNAAIKACPSGWHLPSKVEFETLFTAVGGKLTAGKMLKSQSGWYYNGNGIDAYGFSALPAAARNYHGGFSYADKNAYFWSATKLGKYDAFYLYLYYRSETVYLYDYNKDNALSVRCLRD